MTMSNRKFRVLQIKEVLIDLGEFEEPDLGLGWSRTDERHAVEIAQELNQWDDVFWQVEEA
jgi:hypothetical protein